MSQVSSRTALTLAFALCAPSAWAQDTSPATPNQERGRNTEDRIVFDFANKSLLVYGLHSSKTQGRKNGVDAEFAARREGKQVLMDFFENTCKKVDIESDWTGRMRSKSGWNATGLTSQGSEIFRGAILLIKLVAPFSDVFSKYPPVKVNSITNAQGQNFVFQIPPLPGHILRCGTVEIKLSQSRRIVVAPGYAASGAGATVVHLNAGKEFLEAASPNDEEALKRSEIGTVHDGDSDSRSTPLFLPIVTKSE